MNPKEYYDYIIKYMTPEEALLKLLEGHVMIYKNLKFNKGDEFHPVMLISMAALDMNWSLALPNDDSENVNGMIVGTQKYIDSVLNNNLDNESKGNNNTI